MRSSWATIPAWVWKVAPARSVHEVPAVLRVDEHHALADAQRAVAHARPRRAALAPPRQARDHERSRRRPPATRGCAGPTRVPSEIAQAAANEGPRISTPPSALADLAARRRRPRTQPQAKPTSARRRRRRPWSALRRVVAVARGRSRRIFVSSSRRVAVGSVTSCPSPVRVGGACRAGHDAPRGQGDHDDRERHHDQVRDPRERAVEHRELPWTKRRARSAEAASPADEDRPSGPEDGKAGGVLERVDRLLAQVLARRCARCPPGRP